eukprot:GHVU01120953.1.p3 GENE.GHVU01120953.1~~GHVU01120953.1.p3  ORF type:complete len:106 (-),score=4.86 GHVU01120953.1:147-464(-)
MAILWSFFKNQNTKKLNSVPINSEPESPKNTFLCLLKLKYKKANMLPIMIGISTNNSMSTPQINKPITLIGNKNRKLDKPSIPSMRFMAFTITMYTTMEVVTAIE